MSSLNEPADSAGQPAPPPNEQSDGLPVPPEDVDASHVDPQAANDIPLLDAALSPLEATRPWRVAEALKMLRQQINDAFPQRSKRSDGTIGDTRHRSTVSDHNAHIVQDGVGVVTAFDLTHDPAHGCDAGRIAALLHASQDPRIKYIIWNRRIANASPVGAAPAWAWRAYTGANPHNHHCHISVKAAGNLYDDAAPWSLPLGEGAPESGPLADLDREDTALADIGMALAALGGTNGKPLLQALIDARDTIALLLSRYAEETSIREEREGLEAGRPALALLRDEYAGLFDTCRVKQARSGEVAWHRSRLLKYRLQYEEVAARTGAPWWFVGIVHALEASFNFAGHLHNGDPLTGRTVQVPKGRPVQWNPPSDWVSSAVDAIEHEGYARVDDWGLPAILYRFESYNGFGYRGRGVNTPYLWSFSNHYSAGKFVRDGKFDPSAVSKQCGAAVMLKALVGAGDVRI